MARKETRKARAARTAVDKAKPNGIKYSLTMTNRETGESREYLVPPDLAEFIQMQSQTIEQMRQHINDLTGEETLTPAKH